MAKRQQLGAWGEQHAVRHLESEGCHIMATNWRCPAGEVDIIALDGECLAFVEVRTRRGQAFGTPEDDENGRAQARVCSAHLRAHPT